MAESQVLTWDGVTKFVFRGKDEELTILVVETHSDLSLIHI